MGRQVRCTWRSWDDVVIYETVSVFFSRFKIFDTCDKRGVDFQIFLQSRKTVIPVDVIHT